MSFASHDSTSKGGLRATSQAPRELGDSQKFLEIHDESRICENSVWESPQKPTPSARLFCQNPQIATIPGVSPKEKPRYRVMLASEIWGDRLNLDEALNLVKRGEA
ncbi:MAG: hypothetical protein M3O33_23375 [Cyanobacteriota bacterium]|nr:hypothetical protein [Cyanobacteriota bacterium]